MRNKKVFWVVVIFSLLNILDLITALSIGPAETNPVYNIFNSFVPIIIIKLLLIGLVYVVYHYNYYQTKFLYFIYIFVLLEGIILLCYGIYTNFNVLTHPEIIEVARTISTEVKVRQYFNVFKYFYIFPLVISSLTFWIYNTTERKVEYKEQKFNFKGLK